MCVRLSVSNIYRFCLKHNLYEVVVIISIVTHIFLDIMNNQTHRIDRRTDRPTDRPTGTRMHFCGICRNCKFLSTKQLPCTYINIYAILLCNTNGYHQLILDETLKCFKAIAEALSKNY